MSDDYRCPNCSTAIRATNIEYLYNDGEEDGTVESSHRTPLFNKSEFGPMDRREQLWYCPNKDCRIVRLLPGDTEYPSTNND